VAYLSAQIRGQSRRIVQRSTSWSGKLGPDDFRAFAAPYGAQF